MNRYHYCAWTDEEDSRLTEIMIRGMNERKRVRILFHEAAAKIGRSAKSCENRWYEIRAREAV